MDMALAFAQLEKNDYFIWDDFLSAAEVETMLVDYHERSAQFKRAGVGQGLELQILDQVRTDEIDWFDPLDLNAIQTLLWARFETLKDQINEHFFLGLWSFEGHYSKYKKDGHYEKHLDRFNHDDKRTISLVLYLNPEWDANQKGGELRIYPTGLVPLNILPLAGRLVCFLSAELPHEVITTKQERMSFAGWYKRRA